MTTTAATAQADDPECTDCGGTGITYQTERVCACQSTDAAHVNEPPKSEHAAGNVLTDAALIARLREIQGQAGLFASTAADRIYNLGLLHDMAEARAERLEALLREALRALDPALAERAGEVLAWLSHVDNDGHTRFQGKTTSEHAADLITAMLAQIAALRAERDALAAAKWAEKHTDTMNDMVQMGMVRDEAIARAALTTEADNDRQA